MPKLLLRSAVVVGLLGFTFFFPRLIIRLWGADDPWTSYFYQYGLGLIVFLIGLRLILATGACVPGRGHDRFWLGVLIWGFVFFAALHAVWIWLSLALPYRGG